MDRRRDNRMVKDKGFEEDEEDIQTAAVSVSQPLRPLHEDMHYHNEAGVF